MVVIILIVFGLIAGSFINALVWRVFEQDKLKSQKRKSAEINDFSIVHGRSMCPKCKHILNAKDLIPVLSWVYLRGKCRYCRTSISSQYPIIEIVTAGLFIASYKWWPDQITDYHIAVFTIWLFLLTGLIALAVYDIRWKLLPNRIVYPLIYLAFVQAVVRVVFSTNPLHSMLYGVLAVIIGGGIFYILYQISGGKWIGGGDIRLGALLGLIVFSPSEAFLMIFLASFMGSILSLPVLLTGRIKKDTKIPFGPFLIAATIITVLFGNHIIHWYQNIIMPI